MCFTVSTLNHQLWMCNLPELQVFMGIQYPFLLQEARDKSTQSIQFSYNKSARRWHRVGMQVQVYRVQGVVVVGRLQGCRCCREFAGVQGQQCCRCCREVVGMQGKSVQCCRVQGLYGCTHALFQNSIEFECLQCACLGPRYVVQQVVCMWIRSLCMRSLIFSSSI